MSKAAVMQLEVLCITSPVQTSFLLVVVVRLTSFTDVVFNIRYLLLM
jgi:hypothetical protein